jgi:hypothetical protein
LEGQQVGEKVLEPPTKILTVSVSLLSGGIPWFFLFVLPVLMLYEMGDRLVLILAVQSVSTLAQ